MSGAPTTNQGPLSYAIDNSLASHIPTFARVCQSNVPNMSDFKISKKNTLHFRTNNVASMPQLIDNTVLVTDIDNDIALQADNWNAANANPNIPGSQPPIVVTPLLLVPPPSGEDQLSNLRVIPWDIYSFWYHSNRTDIPVISPVFSNAPQFNFNLMTVKDSYSEYSSLNVFNRFIDLYCRNNNVNENSLDFSFKIDLRQKLAPFTNAYNYTGEYKATSLQELYMSFSESGLLQWDESHLNRRDSRTNIHKGSIVCIEHQYVLIHKVSGDDVIKLVFTVPHYVYLPNWVSQTSISFTQNVLLHKCPTINGSIENASDDIDNNTVPVQNSTVPPQENYSNTHPLGPTGSIGSTGSTGGTGTGP
jgi:hypothetical protein